MCQSWFLRDAKSSIVNVSSDRFSKLTFSNPGSSVELNMPIFIINVIIIIIIIII